MTQLDLTLLLREDLWPDPETRTCRECGCTDDNCRICIERTGESCFWVGDDLCSACASRSGEAALSVAANNDKSRKNAAKDRSRIPPRPEERGIQRGER
ncbi:hypothetical protein [Ruegeria atlantica]|uniref:hypothetical protein n=1 Tax=Ruegeria atlantica TaxID=81569 RepID=UPI00147A8BFB|nr:hypothetical protein [Ruegeria atlantica]